MDALRTKELPADMPETYLWESFLQKLQSSVFTPAFQSGSNSPLRWEDLSKDDKEALLIAIASVHHKTFNYNGFPLELIDAESGKDRTPGFWGVLSLPEHDYSDALPESEGAVCIPDLSAESSFQFLMYGLACNSVMASVEQACIDDFHADFTDQPLEADIVKHYTMHNRSNDDDYFSSEEMFDYPMPDRFDEYLKRPLQEYALTVASYLSHQLLGTEEINPRMLQLMKRDFMGMQHDYLAEFLEDDGRMLNDIDPDYKTQWGKRALSYIQQTFAEPENGEPERAAKMIAALNINGFKYTPQKAVKAALEADKNLWCLSLSEPLEVAGHIKQMPVGELQSLNDDARIALIAKLGKQEGLEKAEHEECDAAAFRILYYDTLDANFVSYYGALFNELGKVLSRDEALQLDAQGWNGAETRNANLQFLLRMNEIISTHFGITARPLVLFENRWQDNARYKKGAAAFAYNNIFADSGMQNHGRMRDLYDMDMPEDLHSFTGINKELLEQSTPYEASSSLVHEIGHHIAFDLRTEFRGKTLAEDDPRYEHVNKLLRWDGAADLDKRLRNEFSYTVYRHIPEEKFSYWAQTAFDQTEAFPFMDRAKTGSGGEITLRKS